MEVWFYFLARLAPSTAIATAYLYSVAGVPTRVAKVFVRRPAGTYGDSNDKNCCASATQYFRAMWCSPPFLAFTHLAMGLNRGHELTGLHRLTRPTVAVIYCYNFQYGQGAKMLHFCHGHPGRSQGQVPTSNLCLPRILFDTGIRDPPNPPKKSTESMLDLMDIGYQTKSSGDIN